MMSVRKSEGTGAKRPKRRNLLSTAYTEYSDGSPGKGLTSPGSLQEGTTVPRPLVAQLVPGCASPATPVDVTAAVRL